MSRENDTDMVARHASRAWPALGLCLLAAPWPQPHNPLGDHRFRIEVEAVNVLVTITDNKTGRFVTDLTRNDFRVYEEGTRQEIFNFTRQANLPLTIALCVDTSSSVKPKLDSEKEVATDFLRSVMRPEDRALLLTFDTGVAVAAHIKALPQATAPRE